MKKHQVVLLIGGNLGDRFSYLAKAVSLLNASFTVIKQSAVYETEAWGPNSSGKYLNQALVIHTNLAAHHVLRVTQQIEASLDRARNIKWGDRTMDIDIIYYDNLIIHTDDLQVPHPLMHQRRFVLMPLAEIIPEFVHPVFLKNQVSLLLELKDSLQVNRLTNQ